MTAVEIAGRPAEITGSAEDGYFQQVAIHAAGLRPLERFARASLPPNACVADIGANIGLTAILFSRLVPGGTVHAFEPSPANAAYLRENLAANAVRNVTVVQAAISDSPGKVSFRHFGNFAAGSRTLIGITGGEGDIEVPTIQLDAYAAERRLCFDMVKIDTEGHEPWVLAGLADQIRADMPIWMEFNSHGLMGSNANPAAFANALAAAFTIERVEPDGALLRIEDSGRLLIENMQRGCVDDVVLRFLPGRALPSLATMTGDHHAVELAEIYRSTSWRVTAPLRAVGDALKRFRA